MSDSPYILEVTHSSFAEKVVENSRRVPVLVDFWADWCAPCKMQMPVLEKLAADYGGKFLVAKVNTEEERELAAEHGIRSLPTLRLYHQGEVVREVMGAQSEAGVRALLEPYLERESDRRRLTALAAHEAGRHEEALQLLREAVDGDPDNPRAQLDLLRLLIDAGAVDEAQDRLQTMPLAMRQSDAMEALNAELTFASTLIGAPSRQELERELEQDPARHEARYRLAARLVQEREYESAMEQLLELLKRDRAFGDEAARKGLVALFDLLGGDDERVVRYRRLMFNYLH